MILLCGGYGLEMIEEKEIEEGVNLPDTKRQGNDNHIHPTCQDLFISLARVCVASFFRYCPIFLVYPSDTPSYIVDGISSTAMC